MNEVDPAFEPPDGEFDHAASGRRYRTYRQDGHLRHAESLLGANGEFPLCDYPLRYLVGSGRFARTYLVEDAGFLVESPVTWYATLDKWAMSPGYDEPVHHSFRRTVGYECLYCHSGSAEPIAGNWDRVQVHEMAIGCERCHGPGSLHVERWSSGGGSLEPEGDLTIVNPGRLPRELAEAVCHQCHLSGVARVAIRGREAADFRPGLRWHDFVIDYEHESSDENMTVVGHVAQMRQSRCYQESTTLTCITCHSLHAQLAPAELKVQHRAACLTCHADASCGLGAVERNTRNGNDCAACHMPQSPTDVPHVAFTHHRIGIHVADSANVTTRRGFEPLVPMLDVSHLPDGDRRRSLGLAYRRYYQENFGTAGSNDYLDQAWSLLEEAAAGGMADPPLALARAELAGSRGNAALSEQLYRQTLSATPLDANEKAIILQALVAQAVQASRWNEAKSHLDELVTLRRDPLSWFLLGMCHRRLGNIDAAIAALERVIEIDPAEAETYEVLAPLYATKGDLERVEWCHEQARRARQAATTP
jgi:tetratricopeptide (TPR) repeat protein